MLLLLLAAVTLAQPQRPLRAGATTVADPPMSPAVVATFVGSGDGSGNAQLDLLVLWRGTPGWFMKGTGGGSSGSSSSGGGAPRGPIVHTIFKGGITLQLWFDPQTRTARIGNRAIDLQDDNVILVDDVDSPAGLTIVGTRRIDHAFSGSPADLRPLLKQSPELVGYLRCDARLEDTRVQQMMDYICASYREP